MSVKQTSKSVTVSVPVMSAAEINARFAALLATDPPLAVALASQRVSAPYLRTDKGNKASVSAPESEADRVCRCAHFFASNRRTIVTALLALLGDKQSIVVTEADLCEATGLTYYRQRPDAVTVSDRFADTNNDKFPLVPQIGYSLRIVGENNTPRVYYFARIASKASKAKGLATRKAKYPNIAKHLREDASEAETRERIANESEGNAS